jgi:hypothetical protein
MQGEGFKIRDARRNDAKSKTPNSRCKKKRCKIQDAEFQMQGERFKIQDSKFNMKDGGADEVRAVRAIAGLAGSY